MEEIKVIYDFITPLAGATMTLCFTYLFYKALKPLIKASERYGYFTELLSNYKIAVLEKKAEENGIKLYEENEPDLNMEQIIENEVKRQLKDKDRIADK